MYARFNAQMNAIGKEWSLFEVIALGGKCNDVVQKPL